MVTAVERGQATPTVASAAKRVEELLDLTLPLDVQVRFQFGSLGNPASPETHLLLTGTCGVGDDVRQDAAGLAIIREFVLAAKEHRVAVRTGDLAGCNSVNADSPRDAFQVAFAYLRAHSVSEMTLAPVEKIVQDALTSTGPTAPSSPVVSPQR